MKTTKTGKRLLAALLTLLSLLPQAAFAGVAWSPNDMFTANMVADPGFEGTAGSKFNGTVMADPTGGGHQNVLSITGAQSHMALKSDKPSQLTLANMLEAKQAIRLQFDYYVVGGDNLRVEIRETNADSAIILANQAQYWSYEVSPIPVIAGTWAHFDAVLDTKKLMAFLTTQSGFAELRYSNMYFFAQGRSAGSSVQSYYDNISITAHDMAVPVQKPVVSLAADASFALDATIANHAGQTGGVYKGALPVNASAQLFKAASIRGYKFIPGTYRLSMWYKEDTANAAIMTRMWRPQVGALQGGPLITSSTGGYFWYPTSSQQPALGNWKQVGMDFNVAENTGVGADTDGVLMTLWWQSRASGEGLSYDPSLNGSYTVYFSDLSLYKLPDPASVTVSLENTSVTVAEGERAVIGASGYIDTAAPASLSAGGGTYTGTIGNVSTTDGYSTAEFSFATTGLAKGTYAATVTVPDLWGRQNALPFTFTVANAAQPDVSLTITQALWSASIAALPRTVLNDSDKKSEIYQFSNSEQFTQTPQQLIAAGRNLVKLTFTAQGDGSSAYTADGAVQLRTGFAVEYSVPVPIANLQDGEPHSYEAVFDLGALSRYYEGGSPPAYTIFDRWNTDWWIRPVNNSSVGTITYDNIQFRYLDEAAATSDTALAKLSVTNNTLAPYRLSGTLIIAKYAGGEFAGIKAKDFDLKNTVSPGGSDLNNGVGSGDSKTISLALPLDSASGVTYKAFWWDGLKQMIPKTDYASKP